jgi:hypothetical protein
MIAWEVCRDMIELIHLCEFTYELVLLAAGSEDDAADSLGLLGSLESLDSLALLDSLLALFALLLLVLLSPLPLRLSLIYHPEPLNTIPTGWNTRRTAPLSPQMHVSSGASLKL